LRTQYLQTIPDIFGEAFGRIFAGVLAPFLIEPHTGSPFAFFGTIVVIVFARRFIPLLFGKRRSASSRRSPS
jgi:hypothetical protein